MNSVVLKLSKNFDEFYVVELESLMREAFTKEFELIVEQGNFMEVHDAPEAGEEYFAAFGPILIKRA